MKWTFFGGEGVIAENVLHEQRKIVKYNQLVANLIILHNVERMTRVLTQLRDEGVVISAEVLRALSPYRIGHINRPFSVSIITTSPSTSVASTLGRRQMRGAVETRMVNVSHQIESMTKACGLVCQRSP